MKRKCIKCETVYTTNNERQVYCSAACKCGDAVVRHRQKRRQYLHDLLGGKCAICGYSKTNRALEFHHVDASKKSFSLSREGQSYSIERATAEAMKCIILCANCHREEQDDLVSMASLVKILSNDAERRSRFKKRYTEDLIMRSRLYCACGASKTRGANKCKICALKAREKIDWPDTCELQEMVSQSNYLQVARKLGVSDNAIRKRLARQR